MRILSQDLRHDFPYEKVCIEVTDSGKVFAQGDLWGNSENNYIQIAEYSTEEKAKKAMEMLRKAYSPKIEIEEPKNIEVPKLRTENWYWSISEPKVEVLDNFYFQFPPDEEIEVWQ